MTAIATDPRDRYATAGALAAALRAAVAAPVDVAAVTPPSAHVAEVDPHARTMPTPPAPEPVPVSRRGADSRVWLVVSIIAAVAGIVLGFWLSMRGR
jgi:hypothetical protein